MANQYARSYAFSRYAKTCDWCERTYSRDVLSPVKTPRGDEWQICTLCWIALDDFVEPCAVNYKLHSRRGADAEIAQAAPLVRQRGKARTKLRTNRPGR